MTMPSTKSISTAVNPLGVASIWSSMIMTFPLFSGPCCLLRTSARSSFLCLLVRLPWTFMIRLGLAPFSRVFLFQTPAAFCISTLILATYIGETPNTLSLLLLSLMCMSSSGVTVLVLSPKLRIHAETGSNLLFVLTGVTSPLLKHHSSRIPEKCVVTG